MQLVSTAGFFFQALSNASVLDSPFVLSASTPLDHSGGEVAFDSNKVKVCSIRCALHRAQVGKVRVLVRAVPTETSIYGLSDDHHSWVQLPLWK